MTHLNDTKFDIFAMDDRARELRAEAVSYGLGHARAWIAARLAAVFGKAASAA